MRRRTYGTRLFEVPETTYSRYPTPVTYRQRGLATDAIEWTGENLDPHVRDFIVLRASADVRDRLELFVAKDGALIVYYGSMSPKVVRKGVFLVDQYQEPSANAFGWVIAEPDRFWHLYQVDEDESKGF